MKVLTFYDGTVHARKALQYGIKTIKEKGGELIVLHVFQSSLFLDYDGGPGALERARAEADQYRRDAEDFVRAAGLGVNVRILSEVGDPEQEILNVATAEQTDIVLIPSRYKAIYKKAPCPVILIPGLTLVPVDNTDIQFDNIDRIREEATAAESKVLLLGILPIHLYSREEKSELENVRKETEIQLKKIETKLDKLGIKTKLIMRSGYPDEEIMKASVEFSASLVVLPSGGSTPSELRKAAEIVADEQNRMKRPFLLVSAPGLPETA